MNLIDRISHQFEDNMRAAGTGERDLDKVLDGETEADRAEDDDDASAD